MVLYGGSILFTRWHSKPKGGSSVSILEEGALATMHLIIDPELARLPDAAPSCITEQAIGSVNSLSSLPLQAAERETRSSPGAPEY